MKSYGVLIMDDKYSPLIVFLLGMIKDVSAEMVGLTVKSRVLKYECEMTGEISLGMVDWNFYLDREKYRYIHPLSNNYLVPACCDAIREAEYDRTAETMCSAALDFKLPTDLARHVMTFILPHALIQDLNMKISVNTLGNKKETREERYRKRKLQAILRNGPGSPRKQAKRNSKKMIRARAACVY
jgi:hypothetical protein